MTLLRSALFNALFHGLTALLVVLALPWLLLPRRAFVPVLRWYGGLMLWLLRVTCGVRIRVEGAHLLPRGGPALIAAKHQSALDTLVWLTLVPDACYVLKRELLWLPVWGWLAQKARMIPVDRKAGARAMRRMLQDAKVAAASGRQIVIFPEGTRTRPGERVPYQPGVVALAGALKLPVLPAATDSGRCWGKHEFRKRAGTVTIALLAPLPASMPRAELLRHVEQAIEESSTALTAKPCG